MSAAAVAVGAGEAAADGCRDGEGVRRYLEGKIMRLQREIAEKEQNTKRLEAQRNELNAKGKSSRRCCCIGFLVGATWQTAVAVGCCPACSSRVAGRNPTSAGARLLRGRGH